ncbi:MAG: CpcT/CpeT family chromophore lyase [Steroidobacteraceae bacterium]
MASGTRVLLVAAAAVLAAGCAGHAKRTDADLVQLTEWLPGFYDNQVQIAEEQQAGRAPGEPVALTVVPVEAQEIGTHVFYMQEMTKGPTAHVILQRLLTFNTGKDEIVETMWSLADPGRWRGADTTPELFTSLQPDDVHPMQGCDLKWKKEGDHFTASNDPARCRMISPRTGGVEFTDMRVELTADELAISTQTARAGVAIVPGAGPYVRFRRNGGS